MPKFLQVPFLMQPEGSSWCGPACAGMVNAYLTGQEVPLQQIAKEFVWRRLSLAGRIGSSPFDVGEWLAKCGVRTEVRLRTSALPDGLIRDLAGPLAALGGTVVDDGLTRQRVRTVIAAGRPIIASVDANILHGILWWPQPHFVVIVAVTHRRVWYLDPEQGEVQVRPWKVFLGASRAVLGAAIFFPEDA